MNEIFKARICEIQKNNFILMTEDTEIHAVLSGRLLYTEQQPVIGDLVDAVMYDDNNALITGINERSSVLKRPDRGGHADSYVKTMLEQVMAVNVDYFFIVTSLNNNFNVNRIARYAAIALSGGCIPVAVLTKADICPEKDEYIAKVKEINKNLEVVCVSSHTGEGLDALRSYLIPGKTIAMMGSSGVGKSTLINTLAGTELMKVSAIREEDSKGRHTTTHRRMFRIDGTYIIDTPGMRELGMCDVEEGIDDSFSDIIELSAKCRFSDCGHTAEPGCAIQKALADGSLSSERWTLYLRLKNESKRGKAMKKSKMTEIARLKKQLPDKLH